MPDSPLNILFLPRWYPNRYDPMPGLFIQRQAETLAVSARVVVLYVHPDPDCPNEFEIEYSREEGVTVVRVYFKTPAIVIPGLFQAMNLINFYRSHIRGLEVVGEFTPDIVHSHILTREAMMGHWFSRRFRVPHVISEHWSRYFPENGTYRGWVRKTITKYLVRRAAALIPVSDLLKQAMMNCHLSNDHTEVVPNVVDIPMAPELPALHRGKEKHFLHVSCFDDRAKNISGLLMAISEVSRRRSDFTCFLAGEGPDFERMKELAAELGLTEDVVVFAGLKRGKELAALYRETDFTVLSSRYETFGTVIIESLACGTPVLSTAVGIAPEAVRETNGILIPADSQEALTDGLEKMLDLAGTFDRQAIKREISGRYTSERVGLMLLGIYAKILGDV